MHRYSYNRSRSIEQSQAKVAVCVQQAVIDQSSSQLFLWMAAIAGALSVVALLG